MLKTDKDLNISSTSRYYENEGVRYFYIGRTPIPNPGLMFVNRENKPFISEGMNDFTQLPSECDSFDWIPPIPRRCISLSNNSNKVYLERVIGSLEITDKNDNNSPYALCEFLTSLISKENTHIGVQPIEIIKSSFVFIINNRRYNVSQKQIKEFLED